MKKPIVYFICTGNSCRSQIAEAWLRHFAGDRFEVHSGGLEAHGMNPRTVATMKEAGLDITTQTSKLLDNELLNRTDYAITLCGDAYDRCPVTPAHVKRLHWGFEDPARATGTEEEIMAKFAEVRDGIKNIIQLFIEEIPAGKDVVEERNH